jgi:apolipoprotein N-acyltransferase
MRRSLAAAFSGALLLLAAPPISLTPLAFVALVPLLVTIRTAGLGAAAVRGWITGATFHLGLVAWLVPTIVRLQDCSTATALALFALYVAYHSLQCGLAASCARLAAPGLGAVTAATAGWVLVEWAFPKVLPWSLGATLGPHPLLRQAADLAGGLGLSAQIVATNALLAEAVRRWHPWPGRAAPALAGAAASLFAGILYSRVPVAGDAGGERLTIGVAQAGGASIHHPDPQRAIDAALHGYARLSGGIATPLDLLVWPERVLPVPLRHNPVQRAVVERHARRLGSPLLLGALDRGDGAERSAVYLFDPTLRAVAHKATLVPFGEYVPGADWLPWLRRWRVVSPIQAGAADPVLRVGAARLAPAICYEAIRAGAYNAAVRAGGEVLLNLSDDSWFDSPWAAAQHLEMTRLRAVETRRWLVRASHSGISAVIDPHGAVVARLPYGRAGTLRGSVARRRQLTPYARHGDAPLLIVAAVLLPLAWATAYARSKSSTSLGALAAMRTVDSSLSAAPSPAARVAPFTATVPRATCTQACRPPASACSTLAPAVSWAAWISAAWCRVTAPSRPSGAAISRNPSRTPDGSARCS